MSHERSLEILACTSLLQRSSKASGLVTRGEFWIAWENSRHLATLPLVSPPDDVWETSAEIPYWWRVTTQIWVVLLTGRAAWEIWFNQSGIFFGRANLFARESAMLVFLLSPIFLCLKIKDGEYNSKNINKQLSPAQNTPAVQAIESLSQNVYTRSKCTNCSPFFRPRALVQSSCNVYWHLPVS